MTTVRTFLAVTLPSSLQQEIAVLQRELFGAMPGIRWTRPDTMHLTLRFFGDIRADDLEKIHASMLSVKLREKAFQVDVLGLGAFPDRRQTLAVIHRPARRGDQLQSNILGGNRQWLTTTVIAP